MRPFALALLFALSTAWAAAAGALAASTAAGSRPAPSVERAELADLVERASAALRTDPQTLFRLTEEALALLARHPDADSEARIRLLRCEYFNERDRDAARRELDRLRELERLLTDKGLRAGALACEGEMHEQAGDNARAMTLYEQAVDAAAAAGDERRHADVLFLRGYLRGVVGDFAGGLADLRRSLALYEKLKLPAQVRTVASGVASLYNRMGALDEALRYYEEALRAEPAGVPTRERVVALHNLGRSFERAGRWSEALLNFEAALAESRALEFVRGQIHALRGIAAVLNAQGDGAGALARIDHALRLAPQVPDEPLRARLLMQRATALRLLKRPAEGQPLLREAILVFQKGDSIADEGEARDELARNAAEGADWRQAHEQLALARKISQDLLRRQIDNRFAAMKAQFDTEAREREFTSLQREHKANETALSEQQRAAKLQIVAMVLASALAAMLGLLAWRQRQSGRRMRSLAMTDELTGLANRRQALAELEQFIGSGPGRGALLILDIDHFKQINDAHGHAAGDEVLRRIAAAWRPLVGTGVSLGRLGGEEFIAFVPDGDLATAAALGERLRDAVSAVDLSESLGLRRVTISAGIAAIRPGDTLASALGRADAALYRAKANGRDRVESAP